MNPTNAPVFQSVAPHFTVPDVVAASKYYCDVLGFRNLGFFGNPRVFAMVGRGPVEFFFNQSPEAAAAKRVRAPVAYDAYVRLTGLDRLHEEISARGAKINSQGYRLALRSRVCARGFRHFNPWKRMKSASLECSSA